MVWKSMQIINYFGYVNNTRILYLKNKFILFFFQFNIDNEMVISIKYI